MFYTEPYFHIAYLSYVIFVGFSPHIYWSSSRESTHLECWNGFHLTLFAQSTVKGRRASYAAVAKLDLREFFSLQSANAYCGVRRFFGVATCTTRNICRMRLLPLNTPKQFGDRFLRYQIFSKGEFFDILSHSVCVSRVIAGIMLEFGIVSGIFPLQNIAIRVPRAAASRFASDGAY